LSESDKMPIGWPPFILSGKPLSFPIVNATTPAGLVQMRRPENL
jgi:hypothetical protein